MSEKAPHVTRYAVPAPPQATAGSDTTTIIASAPFAGEVTGVTYAPNAAITGAATNNRRVALINRGQAGSGTTVIAELTFDTGINAAAGDEKALTLSVVEGATTVAEGDVLAWFSDAVNTGLADPGGLVEITISRS